MGFSRYNIAGGVETKNEPGSKGRVLRNLLHITRKRVIDQAEANALLDAQERYLNRVTGKTAFTSEMICQMHFDWLGGIYAWAGRYRSVDMTKGAFTWPPASRVASNMIALERNVLGRLTPCAPGPRNQVALAMAEVQAELILVHPFREGNGRLARWVTDLMASQAGLSPPDYGFVGKGSFKRRGEYLQAVVAGYSGDYTYLTRFLCDALARTPEI